MFSCLKRPEPTLALAGFCLMLLQFAMIREVTTLLRGTEVVIILGSVAIVLCFSRPFYYNHCFAFYFFLGEIFANIVQRSSLVFFK